MSNQAKLEKFIEGKSYINDECKKIIQIADEQSFNVREVVFYVMKNYTGIDQFLINWMLVSTHLRGTKPHLMDKMNDIYDRTLNEWILYPKNIKDKDLFLLKANTEIVSIHNY